MRPSMHHVEKGHALDSELAIMSRLNHPNVLRVHGGCSLQCRDSGSTTSSSPWRLMVMELCEGNLSSALLLHSGNALPPLPLREVLRVSECLEAYHI